MNIYLPWPLIIFFAIAGVYLAWRVLSGIAKFFSAESGSPEATAMLDEYEGDTYEDSDDEALFDKAGRCYPRGRAGSFAVDIANGELEPIYLLRLDSDERDEVRRLLDGHGLGSLIPSFFDMIEQATPEQYTSWLRGHRAKGGRLTHAYDYNLPSSFWFASSNFDLPIAYGADSISLIVPEDVEVTTNDGLGHNSLFLMKDFTFKGSSVPTYANVPV